MGGIDSGHQLEKGDIEKFTNFEYQARCEKTLFECCKRKLFRLYESFVSHDTKRCKLFKRIKSSLSDRESKNESFLKKRVLKLIKELTRYCENRKGTMYSEKLNRHSYREFDLRQKQSRRHLSLYDSFISSFFIMFIKLMWILKHPGNTKHLLLVT